MKNPTTNVMSWQEAQDILITMFPAPKYTVTMAHSQHFGVHPLSDTSALVWEGFPGVNGNCLYQERAYDDQHAYDEGGWATVVNRIREKHEAEQELLYAIVEAQP